MPAPPPNTVSFVQQCRPARARLPFPFVTQAPPQPVAVKPVEAVAPAPVPDVSAARRGFAVVVASHLNVDLYPIFIVALAVSLQENLALTNAQRAMVIAIGPIVSGVCQPLFAWIGDKLNTRLFGPLGLAVGAACISSIGFAQSLPQLLVLQTVGLIGVGIYHPISSAVAGKLGRDALTGVRFVRSARTTALSIFFLAGMLGGTFGPVIASGLNRATGDMRWLSVMIVPGLVMAWILWGATRRTEHKTAKPHDAPEDEPAHLAVRRRAVGLLFASNSLRFIANVGCYFLFTAWARQNFENADIASSKASLLVAATTLGMAVATVIAAFQHAGGERRLLALTGFLSVPFIVAIPFLPMHMMMLAAFIAASLYFVAIPAGISLSHRLLPHATGMTGSLLMGAGWVLSSLGPIIGEQIIALAPEHGLHLAFAFMALMLALSGVAGLLLDPKVIQETLDE